MHRVHFTILATLLLGSSAAQADDAAPVASPQPGTPASAPPPGGPPHHNEIAGIELPNDVPIPNMDVSVRGIIGVRGDYTHATNGFGTLGAQFALGFDGFGSVETYIIRASAEGGIGGGGRGFDGDFGLALFAGKRWNVIDRGGPFVRLGGDGRLGGNGLLYASRIVVPELEAGFQVLRSPNVVDVALYGGPMIDGRANIGDDARKIGGALAYGLRVAVHQGIFFVVADGNFTTATGGFSDQAITASARACVAVFPVALCLDGLVVHADQAHEAVVLGQPANVEHEGATGAQAGVSFGLGL